MGVKSPTADIFRRSGGKAQTPEHSKTQMCPQSKGHGSALEPGAGNADVTGLGVHHGSDGPSAPSVSRLLLEAGKPYICSPYPLPVSAPRIRSLVSVHHIRLCPHHHRPSSLHPTQSSLSSCLSPNLPFTLRTPGVRLRATLPQHDPTALFPNPLPFSVLGLRTARRPWGQSSTLAPRKHVRTPGSSSTMGTLPTNYPGNQDALSGGLAPISQTF